MVIKRNNNFENLQARKPANREGQPAPLARHRDERVKYIQV